MCPKFKEGICEIAGIEPEYVGCVDQECCFKNSEYKECKLYHAGLAEKCIRLLMTA